MLAAFKPVQGQQNTFALTSQDGSKALVLKATNDAAGLWVVDNKTQQQIAVASIQDAGVAVLSSHDQKWQAISKSDQFKSDQLQQHQQALTINLDHQRQDNSAFGTQNPSDQPQQRNRTQPRTQPNTQENRQQ